MTLGVIFFFTACDTESTTHYFDAAIDPIFDRFVVKPLASVIFFDLLFWDNATANDEQLPLIVVWLITGASYFTIRYRFVNLRGFGHAIRVLLSSEKKENTGHRAQEGAADSYPQGEVSHFQALSSALSATVGLGNLGGVAVAVGLGGPGAVVWMVLAGFLGMSSKFVECSLSQMYRTVTSSGHISGGPMHYIEAAVCERFGTERRGIGRIASGIFCVLCIGASLGAGCMFQSNQSYAQTARYMPVFEGTTGALIFGGILAVLVGIVIIGGVKRIGKVAAFVVPVMCFVYLSCGLFVLATHLSEIPSALALIWNQAFRPDSAFGGALGVMVMGLRRASFSNEAGVGSAPIVHAAATTDEPVREGIVALLEPFIDTIVICTITALVVVITGAYKEPGQGIVMTSNAFASVLPWFPSVLTVAVWMFAFSTMISWSYYGERCVEHLLGQGWVVGFRWMFLAFAILGVLLPLRSVVDFSDLMLLGMAFLNMPALILLGPRLQKELNRYWSKYVTT